MPSRNEVRFMGHLGRTPKLTYTPSGSAVLAFSVAATRRWKAKGSDDWSEETTWLDVEAWGKLAENISEKIGKGSLVDVTGRLKLDQWEDKDGNKRSKMKCVANSVLYFNSTGTGSNEKPQDSPGDPPFDDDIPF